MRTLMLFLLAAAVLGTGGAPVATAETLLALVDTGELFVSTDDGGTWSIRSTLPVSDATALIAGGSASELYLASGSGTIYRSSNGGGAWVARGSVGAADVVDLAGRTDGMLLVLTRSGTVYQSTDQGATYAVRGLLTASNLVSLARNEDGRCFALTETGEVARSNDGGKNWDVVGAMPVSDAVTLRPLGSYLFVLTSTGLTYRSTDLGVSWTAVGTVSQTGMVALVQATSTMVAASREGMVARSRSGGLWRWVGSINQLHVTALANDNPQTIGVPPGGGTPSAGFTMAPPWPNPLPRSSGRVRVPFSLTGSATVILQLFDARGRLVDERPPELYGEAGDQLLQWHPRATAGGIYFLRMTTDRGDEATSRLTVLP